MAYNDDSCYYNDAEDTYAEEEEDEEEDASSRDYIVLKPEDINYHIEENISKLASVLCLSKADATTLLLHFQWSVGKVHDAWFADDKSTREKAGLVDKPLMNNQCKSDPSNITCLICFETYAARETASAPCGHRFCKTCWKSYIKTMINEGPGCLTMRCPDPDCSAAVDRDLIKSLTTSAEEERYSRYLIMSYAEQNKKMKWCPAPGCEKAIYFTVGCGKHDILCDCTYYFCWNCGEEAHRPLDCKTVAEWIKKNSSESENVNYILAFTKPCPKCNRPIEKNQGCNHMTCRAPCLHQFCWACLSDWKGHYNCNKYDSGSKQREYARKDLKRYHHYFERWANNQRATKKATGEFRQTVDKQEDQLMKTQSQPASQTKFLTDAWKQIIECRKVLMWTYVYGYYLPQEESAKRNLFEDLQGAAERLLEMLHSCAEEEIGNYLYTRRQMEFVQFRKKVMGLTQMTKKYFANLVTALENGLSEVKAVGCSRPRSKRMKKGDGSSRDKEEEEEKEEDWLCDFCSAVNSSYLERCHSCDRGEWVCGNCTFANVRTAEICQMCDADHSVNAFDD